MLAYEPVEVSVVAGHAGDRHVGEHDEVVVQPVVDVAAVESGAVVAGSAELEDDGGRAGGGRGSEQFAGFVAVSDGEVDRPVELGEHVGVGADEDAVEGVVRQDAGLRPAVGVELSGVERPVHHVDVELQVADGRAGVGDDGDRADPWR